MGHKFLLSVAVMKASLGEQNWLHWTTIFINSDLLLAGKTGRYYTNVSIVNEAKDGMLNRWKLQRSIRMFQNCWPTYLKIVKILRDLWVLLQLLKKITQSLYPLLYVWQRYHHQQKNWYNRDYHVLQRRIKITTQN